LEIYLDNSATTKPCKQAVEACVLAMTTEYGNPSSLHKKGFSAEKMVEKSRGEIAKALSCESSEIIFTSGATESNNLAIIGSAIANKRRGNKIITTAIEHPSVKNAVKHLESIGFEVIEVMPNENGEYLPNMFAELVDDKTILISVMYVNNETGLILPFQEIAKGVKQVNPNIIVHVDAVQGFLKMPIKLKNSAVDLLSLSGHKVYAPKGIGALYIKKGVRLISQSYGGGQQNGIRVGTEPTPLIFALGEAVSAQSSKVNSALENYKMLKEYLLKKLGHITQVTINSHENSAPYIINMAISQIRSEVMLHFLEQDDIYVSSGSACSKGKGSPVLKALGIDKEISDTCIRVSFGADTTTEQLDKFVKRLEDGINSLVRIAKIKQ